jgi:transcriptional regulator with XRE-family HTH domain
VTSGGPGRPTALGRLLKTRREERGYSRTRVAQLTGIKSITIEGWENGRVKKPPIHDVLRLARALSIPTDELERAVWEDAAAAGETTDAARAPHGGHEASPVGLQLLERAIALRDWSAEDAAMALNTTPERVVALRRGDEELAVLEMMALIAVLAAHPAGKGGASSREVSKLLARLRGVRV